MADTLSMKHFGSLAHIIMVFIPLLMDLRKDWVELGMKQQGGLLVSFHVRPILVKWVIEA